MKLTVFGASGQVGRLVVEQALTAGHDVTAVVRDAAKAPAGAHVVRAELHEPLDDAVAGRDAVLSAIGAPDRKHAGIAEAGTRHITAAMLATGVRRISVVSAAPVGGPDPDAPWLFRRVAIPLLDRFFAAVYADLAAMEAVLAASGLDWTAVRPPRLLNGPARGYRSTVGSAVPDGSTVRRADVAHAMLASLERPEWIGHPVGVAA